MRVIGEREIVAGRLSETLGNAARILVPVGFPRQSLGDIIGVLTEGEDPRVQVPFGGRQLRPPVAGWVLWWWAAVSVPLIWLLDVVRALDGVGILVLLGGGRRDAEVDDLHGPVCHVIAGLGTGGAQRQLVEYLRHAAPPVTDLRVLTLFDDDARFADQVRQTGVDVEVVYHRLRRSRWRHVAARALPHTTTALALRRRLVELRPRCIVSWLFVADVITAAAVGSRPRAELIGWVRNLSTWKTWTEYRRWWVRAADRRAARRASRLLANSRAVARDYERWAGLAEGSLQVLVNGVDVDRIRQAATEVEADHSRLTPGLPVLVTVGRLAREKNLGMLVECCRRLDAAGRPAHLVIVGHGELEAELRSDVARSGVAHRVAIVGGTDRPEVWLARADLFVLASRIEGMPNALLEAQALGVPAVTTAAGGAAEVVEDGVTGAVVAVDDVDAFSEAVARLLDDPTTRLEMGRRAAERVAARFSISRFTNELDVLTGRGAAVSR